MSIFADFQVSGQNPSTVSGQGTLPKYFPRVLGSSIGTPSVGPSASVAAGQLLIPAANAVHGTQFKVRIGGDITLGTTGNPSITIDLVANTNTNSTATPNWVAIASTGLIQSLPALTPLNWLLETTLFGDNNTGLLSGYFIGSLNNTNVPNNSLTAITNPPSGLNFVKGQSGPGAVPGAVIGLAVRATFGVSLDQNTARLTQFQITAD